MSADARLAHLKVDLGLPRPTADQVTYLSALLTQAEGYIARQGAALTESDDDDMLVSALAAWMYRTRAMADAPRLPPMLRTQINDRLCAQKMEADA